MINSTPAIPDCPGPIADTKTPRHVTPLNACDCHFHIFGPYDRFPLAQKRGYSPPAAPVARYQQLMHKLGLGRCVIVQPSVYASDNRATLEAARQLNAPHDCRIVVVIDDTTTRQELQAFQQAGVRGVRLNLVAGGGPSLDLVHNVADRIADFGWHLQIYAGSHIIAEAADKLARLSVDLVIDHFGALAPNDAVSTDADAIVRLLEGGHCWIKLSGGYICSASTAPWSDMTAIAQRLIRASPDRIVWGTNWPHPVRFSAMPNDGDIIDALHEWIDDPRIVERILSENPARLYGFE